MTKPRTAAYLVSLLMLAVLVLAACAGDDDDSGVESDAAFDTTAAASDATVDSDTGGDAAADEASSEGGVASSPEALPAVLEQPSTRQIIFTAEMTVAVDDVVGAGATATAIVEDLGGFLFGQETVGLPEPGSTLIFKVDPARFDDALEALSSIGEVRTQSVSADDVTEQIVDLESGIATAEASVERLRDLIADAPGVQAIVRLEDQLLERETELATMRGRLRTLEDSVALATIVTTFTEAVSRPQLELAVTAYPSRTDDGQSCPGDPGVSVEEGSPVTVCFELTNTGDMPLSEFDIRDTVLDLGIDDMIVVSGDPAATLEPGQFLILASETTPERTTRTQARALAVPVDPNGDALENRPVSTTGAIVIEAVDPGGLPGFGDGLSAGMEFLASIGGGVVLLAGALLPFIWVPFVLWAIIHWRRRRNEDRLATPDRETAAIHSDTEFESTE